MRTITTALLFLSFFNVAYSQNEITISYNESIQLKKINSTTHFYISSDYGKVHLKGDKINEYKFERPGHYQVKIVEGSHKKSGSCEHESLPQNLTVNVSRIKMKFEAQGVVFSEPIRKNVETSNIVMSIPVVVETYDHQPIFLSTAPVYSAGIGTSIVGQLVTTQKQLSEGKHLVQYALSGSVAENSYLMFDFVDANAKVQSVALLTPVKD